MFAMQFAKARGAQVIITSSSDEKLARARELGADFTINYRTTPAWGDRARELTGGCGVDVVVEVGGEKTFAESMKAARVGGAIVVIGILGGVTVPLSLPALFSNNLRVIGISVGNREQFEDMSDHIDRWRLRPVIDQIFDISQIREALRFVDGGGHFGKVVLRF
jgi:NADPH:quinone reductase-like Zn-dependent oxidoreductase